MAKSSGTSSTFRIVALTITLCLIVAGALVFFQASSGSSAAELAALSQSLPDRASAALSGTGGGFAAFDSSIKKIRRLRQAGDPAVPGNSNDWRALDVRAEAILAKRADIEALFNASTAIASTPAIASFSFRSSLTSLIPFKRYEFPFGPRHRLGIQEIHTPVIILLT